MSPAWRRSWGLPERVGLLRLSSTFGVVGRPHTMPLSRPLASARRRSLIHPASHAPNLARQTQPDECLLSSVRCRRRKGARLRCTPQPLGRELYLSLPFSQAQPLCARRLSPRTPRTHVAVPPASARSLPRCAPHTHLLSAVSTHCAGALSVASRSTSRRRVHNGAVLRRPSSSGLGLPGPAERSRDQARKYY